MNTCFNYFSPKWPRWEENRIYTFVERKKWNDKTKKKRERERDWKNVEFHLKQSIVFLKKSLNIHSGAETFSSWLFHNIYFLIQCIFFNDSTEKKISFTIL